MKRDHRIVRTGWVGRTFTLRGSWLGGDDERPGVYRTRGAPADYDPEDWPPRKVRVTIERLDEPEPAE